MEPLRFACGQAAVSITAALAQRYWLGSVEGLEKLPPRPSVIIANHESYLDFLLLGYAMDRMANRPFAFWAKRRMIRNQPWASFNSIFPCIEVGGSTNPRAAFRQTRRLLREGWDVCIFPEGQRSRTGLLGSFNEGYLLVAKELNAPIVPAFIDNAFETWPPNKALPKMSPCSLRFHKAIETNSLQTRDELTRLNQSLRHRYLNWKQEKSPSNYEVPKAS